MSNVTGAGTVWNAPNYVGELFLAGQNQTPFLNMIGGLNGGKQVNAWEYAMDQNYSLEAVSSQQAITETQSLTAPTPITYVRAQDVNTCQIYRQAISLSYAKMSNTGGLVPVATGLMPAGQQPVISEKDFQIQAALKNIAVQVEYNFINGAYQQATNAATAAKTGGMLEVCATRNTVAAGTTDFSKALLDSLLAEMAGNGASFSNMVLFANAFQVQAISDVFGYAPDDRTVGGIAIKKIITDFCEMGVVYTPKMPAGSILLANVGICAPVFLPVPGKGYLFYEDFGKTAAFEGGEVYGQIGLTSGYGYEHGSITGLTTS